MHTHVLHILQGDVLSHTPQRIDILALRDSLIIQHTLKLERCHDANFVATDDKVGIMVTLGFQSHKIDSSVTNSRAINYRYRSSHTGGLM